MPAGGAGGDVGGMGGDPVGGADTGGAGGDPAGACPAINAPAGSVLPAPQAVISEIAPGMYIMIHNNTDAELPLAGLGLCANYAFYSSIPALNPPVMAIPPRGFVAIPWNESMNAASVTAESGEMILFEGDFVPSDTGEDVLDFVCWGDNPDTHGRKDGSDSESQRWFDEGCAPGTTAGAIRRIPGSSGEDSASYDASASPMMCP